MSSESQGVFWVGPDEDVIYSIGGFGNTPPASDVVNVFNTSSHQWSNVSVTGGNFNYKSRQGSSVASTTNTNVGLGFVSGGDGVGPDLLTGMVRINMSDTQHPTWANLTDNPPLSLEGSTEFVRYGSEGVLIAFGGFNVRMFILD